MCFFGLRKISLVYSCLVLGVFVLLRVGLVLWVLPDVLTCFGCWVAMLNGDLCVLLVWLFVLIFGVFVCSGVCFDFSYFYVCVGWSVCLGLQLLY